MEKIRRFLEKVKDKLIICLSIVGRRTKSLLKRKKQSKKSQLDGKPKKSSFNKYNWRRIGLIAGISLAALFILATAVFSAGIYYFKWEDKATAFVKRTFPFPAAVVGLKTITINQVEEEASRVEFFYDQQSPSEAGELPSKEVLRNQVLERLIETLIVKNLSKKYDVETAGDEIDSQYQTIAEQNGGGEKLQTLLKENYDMTVAQFKELIYRSLLYEQLRQKFENDLRAKVKVRHILIKVGSKASKKQEKKAKAQAEKVLKLINKEGADFAKIARKYSQDKASKNKGGELPLFGRGDMVEAFENKAFEMDIGQISGLVKSRYGYHIILLENKQGEVEDNYTDWLDSMKESWFVYKLIRW